MTYIDWNVIFLIMGMMIVIAVVENTGIFQWLAFFAYRVSGGRMWLLLAKLAESAQITEPDNLKKAGMVGGGMLILFITGESFHMLPAVNALIGGTALLIWIRPDIEEMIEAVDWTTLVFFMSLFIVVGAIQEVGLISFIADFIANLVGDSLLLAMVTVTWFSAILSTVIANIPFTAAMLPVIGFLTATIPGLRATPCSTASPSVRQWEGMGLSSGLLPTWLPPGSPTQLDTRLATRTFSRKASLLFYSPSAWL